MQKAFLDDAMTKCLKQSKLNHLSVFNFKCNAMCDFFSMVQNSFRRKCS